MEWIPLALLTHFFWGLSNVGDKFIVSNNIKNGYVYQVVIAMLGILSVLLIPFIDFQVSSLEVLAILALGALFLFAAGFPYIKAVQMEDVTRLNVWWVFIPIFTLLIGWVWIGETLHGVQWLAFVILIGAAIVASIHIKKNFIRFSRALPVMILSCLLYSVYGVAARVLTSYLSFGNIFVWIHLMMFVYSFVLLIVWRGLRMDCRRELGDLSGGLMGAIVGISIANNLGFLFSNWALTFGPVALVFAMEGSQPIIVFGMVLLLSIFTKINLREELDKWNVVLKLLAIVMMLGGILLLYLG